MTLGGRLEPLLHESHQMRTTPGEPVLRLFCLSTRHPNHHVKLGQLRRRPLQQFGVNGSGPGAAIRALGSGSTRPGRGSGARPNVLGSGQQGTSGVFAHRSGPLISTTVVRTEYASTPSER